MIGFFLFGGLSRWQARPSLHDDPPETAIKLETCQEQGASDGGVQDSEVGPGDGQISHHNPEGDHQTDQKIAPPPLKGEDAGLLC